MGCATWLANLGRRSFVLWWLIERDNHIPITTHSQFGGLRICYGQVGAHKHNLFIARRVGCPDVVLGRIDIVCHGWLVPRCLEEWVCPTGGYRRACRFKGTGEGYCFKLTSAAATAQRLKALNAASGPIEARAGPIFTELEKAIGAPQAGIARQGPSLTLALIPSAAGLLVLWTSASAPVSSPPSLRR